MFNWLANIKLRLGWRTTQKKLVADIAMLSAMAIEADRQAAEADKALQAPGLLHHKTKILKVYRFHKKNAEGIRMQVRRKQSQLREEGAKFKFALEV